MVNPSILHNGYHIRNSRRYVRCNKGHADRKNCRRSLWPLWQGRQHVGWSGSVHAAVTAKGSFFQTPQETADKLLHKLRESYAKNEAGKGSLQEERISPESYELLTTRKARLEVSLHSKPHFQFLPSSNETSKVLTLEVVLVGPVGRRVVDNCPCLMRGGNITSW